MWLIETLSIFHKTMEQGLEDSRWMNRIGVDNYPIESQDDFDDYNERLHEHKLLFEQDFPSKVRYSFVTLAYMVFEDRAKALCSELNTRKIIVDKVLSEGPGFVKHLKDFLSTDWVTEEMWKELFAFTTIRNCLIHSDGRPGRGSWSPLGGATLLTVSSAVRQEPSALKYYKSCNKIWAELG